MEFFDPPSKVTQMFSAGCRRFGGIVSAILGVCGQKLAREENMRDTETQYHGLKSALLGASLVFLGYLLALFAEHRLPLAQAAGKTATTNVTHAPEPPRVPSQVAASGSGWRSPEEQRTIEIYKATNQAVAFILTTTLTVDPYDFFQEVHPREGSGSGVIIDAQKGLVLTNLHVIQNANKIEIILADGQSHAAKLLGFDREYDVAILQISAPPQDLVSVSMGDSSQLEVGQRVLAIGNPFGLNRTLTTGVISSLDRSVKAPAGGVMRGLVQTDAAINPGNSGGPLLDLDGRLIGINTAILSQSGDSAGIGFAVPINQIKRFLPELIATGRVLRPKFGWTLEDTDHGAMVRIVQPEGPADKAGVQGATRPVSSAFLRGYVVDYSRADLVYAIDGERVTSKEQVDDRIQKAERGATFSFTLRRGGIRGPERTVKIKPVLR
jgi:S1-C subfamily serine protease